MALYLYKGTRAKSTKIRPPVNFVIYRSYKDHFLIKWSWHQGLNVYLWHANNSYMFTNIGKHLYIYHSYFGLDEQEYISLGISQLNYSTERAIIYEMLVIDSIKDSIGLMYTSIFMQNNCHLFQLKFAADLPILCTHNEKL